MLERKQRRPYWRLTRATMLTCVAVLLLALPSLPWLVALLDRRHFMGFPLGYLVAAHGFTLLVVALVIWQTRRQDRIDRRFGAHEDF
jgi:putative solute:sodium symporter small subunit